MKKITTISCGLSLIASAFVWLPLINAAADRADFSLLGNLILPTILANIGILALVWLNWLLRRNK